jgi:predicted CxxxxCH...CXXCH cytochrome family protein
MMSRGDWGRAATVLMMSTALTAAGCRSRPAATSSDEPSGVRSARSASASTASAATGLHDLHVKGSVVRGPLACAECHLCPGPTPQWGAVASARSAAPSWSASAATCSGVYCHGVTLTAPAATSSMVSWGASAPDYGSQPLSVTCAACHGYPPPSHGAAQTDCNRCHSATVKPDGSIDVAGGRHVDGKLDFSSSVSGWDCAGCHGFPPSTGMGAGAHALHYGLSSVAGYGDTDVLQDRYPSATPLTAPGVYAFGCGLCHPLDGSKHMDGTVEVEVARVAGAGLKALARTDAAYDSSSGTCSGVYCHSTGQASPTYKTTPSWFTTSYSSPSTRCSQCHDDPPTYANGNSHLSLDASGNPVQGHVLGWPGPSHGSKHGGGPGYPSYYPQPIDSTPITCQTCHFDTVDPLNTTLNGSGQPVGYYYLDTGGALATACAPCHTAGGTPAAGNGKILPFRHVNGTRDVVFDKRTGVDDGPSGRSLPTWLPAVANSKAATGVAITPTHVYWMTDEANQVWGCNGSFSWWTGYVATCPPGVVFHPNYYWNTSVTPNVWSLNNNGTIEFSLQNATYDPSTRSCSGVSCHPDNATYPAARPPPVWGGSVRCGPCHG